MAYVPQDPTLFRTSVLDNIAYGSGFADHGTQLDVMVRKASIKANSHEFVEALPGQYNAPVMEKGCNFSSGQRQRIACARALMRNPRILLLDEPTSALDDISKELVQQSLQDERGQRTIVAATHDTSLCKKADFVAAMHFGKVLRYGQASEVTIDMVHS